MFYHRFVVRVFLILCHVLKHGGKKPDSLPSVMLKKTTCHLAIKHIAEFKHFPQCRQKNLYLTALDHKGVANDVAALMYNCCLS